MYSLSSMLFPEHLLWCFLNLGCRGCVAMYQLEMDTPHFVGLWILTRCEFLWWSQSVQKQVSLMINKCYTYLWIFGIGNYTSLGSSASLSMGSWLGYSNRYEFFPFEWALSPIRLLLAIFQIKVALLQPWIPLAVLIIDVVCNQCLQCLLLPSFYQQIGCCRESRVSVTPV